MADQLLASVRADIASQVEEQISQSDHAAKDKDKARALQASFATFMEANPEPDPEYLAMAEAMMDDAYANRTVYCGDTVTRYVDGVKQD